MDPKLQQVFDESAAEVSKWPEWMKSEELKEREATMSNQQRKGFEEWHERRYGLRPVLGTDGEYGIEATRFMFEAWQASTHKAEERIRTLEGVLRELTEDFERYATHDEQCPVSRRLDLPCDCFYDEKWDKWCVKKQALAGASEVSKEAGNGTGT